MMHLAPLLEQAPSALTQAELHPERGVLLVSAIGLLLFGGILLMFLVSVARGLGAGLRTGSWWRPFESDADGRHGILARSRFFASFRAPEPSRRTRAGLLIRWAVWGVVVLGLSWYPASLAVQIVRALRT